MSITVAELHRLVKATVELHENNYTSDGQYTLHWWDCATQVCGENVTWLPLVHFLATSGEGVDVVEGMAKK
jgi:hypothetical protein